LIFQVTDSRVEGENISSINIQYANERSEWRSSRNVPFVKSVLAGAEVVLLKDSDSQALPCSWKLFLEEIQ